MGAIRESFYSDLEINEILSNIENKSEYIRSAIKEKNEKEKAPEELEQEITNVEKESKKRIEALKQLKTKSEKNKELRKKQNKIKEKLFLMELKKVCNEIPQSDKYLMNKLREFNTKFECGVDLTEFKQKIRNPQ